MAKKSARKEITKINLKQAALEGLSYERACETAKRAGKPSYRFTVGDKVQVGHIPYEKLQEIEKRIRYIAASMFSVQAKKRSASTAILI